MKKILILILLTAFMQTNANALPSKDLTPHIANIPNGKVEYYRFGHGTPLVLITGYFANVKTWNKPFLETLAKEHDVIIFDNRNVGGSINTSKSYTARDLAEDTNDLLKALHLSQINLLGISMGGMIAQQFAIMYPEKVDHLILVNTFIAGMPPHMPSQKVKDELTNQPKNKFKLYLTALQILFPKEACFKMFFTFMYERFNPPTQEKPISPTVIKQQQQLVLDWIKDTEALKKIRQLKMPVLILSGGSDAMIPYQNTDILNKEIPHSTLVRWQDGGHAMFFQHPVAIANVINQWLLGSPSVIQKS
jgi:pimeloyl-ACP methyl ester carboxylesterase